MSTSNISEVFSQLESSQTKNQIFYQTKGKSINYKQLLTDIDKIHVLIQNAKLNLGDKVILSTKDDYYTALFFIAQLRYGLVTVFLDPDVKKERALSIINNSAPKGFIMDEDLFDEREIYPDNKLFQLKIKPKTQKKGKLFNRLLKNKKNIDLTSDSTFPKVLDSINEQPSKLQKIEDSDLAYVIYTSGTTSSPKGVLISHGNLFSHLKTLSNVYCLDKNAVLLNILMMYHADGCIQGPLLSLYNHATWLRPFTFDLAKIGDLFNSVYKYRATHFITVPTVLSFMEKFKENFEDSFDTEDFKFVISVASKLETSLWHNFENTFNTEILNVYGLTETVAGSFFCSINDPSIKGSIGKPVDCEAKIIKEDGKLALADEKGTLWLKGKHIFQGYLNNPKAMKQVMENDWFNTGDIVIKNDKGIYKVVGRNKNTVNAGGVNIYPEQVTEMLTTHSNILDSICIGVPDKNFGEKLVAAIISHDHNPIDKSILTDFLRPLLEQNQIPKEFYFFEELPRGLSGKINISKTKELVIAKSKDSSFNTDQGDHQSSIIKAASEAFGVASNEIDMNDNSNSLNGWDSMGHLVFITNLEDQYKVKFSTAEMMTMNSLSNTERILTKKLTQR